MLDRSTQRLPAARAAARQGRASSSKRALHAAVQCLVVAIAPNEGALGSEAFGRFYYLTDYGEVYERNDRWLSFFSMVAGRLVDLLAPASVLDAGCALGFLVEGLVRHGVDAHGIDISEWAIANVDPSIADRVAVGSLTEPLTGRYDLVTCLEVLEHLPPDAGEAAIANLCAVTDRVVFCSTPGHYADTTHLNVQPIEWWAERFASHGFLRNPDLNVGFIVPWAVVFDRAPGSRRELVRRYERELGRLRIERNEVRGALLGARRQLDEIMVAAASASDTETSPVDPLVALQRLGDQTAADRLTIEQLQNEIEQLRDELRGQAARLEAERHRHAAAAQLREEQLTEALGRLELANARSEQQTVAARAHEERLNTTGARLAALERELADRSAHDEEVAHALGRLEALELEREHLLAAVRHRDELLASVSWRIGRAVVAPASRLRRILGGPPA